ncbi:leucine-rich repeat-containing protein 37A-like isoform X2 [Balaenoptera ricei]|uniref:leucine-rich repeat-containing protein 37A-like isoform X2 n=1 Tax=Balaenoptera ricei TaxID=2746895 RepID=UPI0028BEF9B9|nr:leucine-rich repeat-containing protein 37A-like isoform X2 [Balaenoptera ricei]
MWLRLLSGLGHCAWEPPRVMSRLPLLLPRLFLTCQQLWLLLLAVQPPEWARDPVQVTPNPARLTEAWSSYTSDLPPKLPHALTPLAEARGFNYLTSSSPVQMLAPPHQELTETEVPYPDTDSVGELPTGPDQFAVPHQDRNNKQTQHQKLPEEVPVLDWNQNQALVLPSRHKSKRKNVHPDQAEGHQSFKILVPPVGSKSSKPVKFIVSPPNLKKDLVQHQRLAKFVGTTGQFEEKVQGLEQLQGDYLDPSMDAFYPEERLPTDFLGSPDEPPEPPEEAEISPSQQEAHTRHPERTEEAESLPQHEAPAQHPQTPEEVESFSPQAEARAQPPEPAEEVEPPPLQQEAPSQPSEAPEELETSSPQEALAQALETLKEVVVQPVAHHGVNEAQQSNLYHVTVKPLDLALTITPQVTKEVEPSPVQQETPSQPPESPEEVEPPPVQQRAPSQPPELPEEVEPSLLHQEAPTETPGFPTEYVLQIPVSDEVASLPGVQRHAHSNLPSVTLQPLDLELTITPEPTTEAELPTAQQEALAPPLEHPEERESSPTQQETLAKPPEPPGEVEPSREREQPAPPPEPSSGEVEPSPTQQEQPAQPPEHLEMTVSPPSHHHAEHSNLSSVAVKPADVELTITKEPTPEVGPSPNQQKPSAQASVPLTNAEFSTTQHEAPTLPSQPPEEVEPLPVQQEASAQSPEAGPHNKPSVQEETPAQYPEHPGEEVTPATTQQETPDQHPQAPEVVPSPPQQEARAQHPQSPGEVESSPTQSPELSNVTVVFSPEHHVTTVSPLGQDQAQLLQRPDVTVKPVGLALIVTPAFTNEVETSPPQQETSAQSTVSPEQLEPLSVQQEVSDQHPTPTENVEPFPVQQGAPTQPTYPEVTFPNPEHVQAQHPTLTEVTIQPLDLELTIRPEPTKEDEPSPTMQGTLTQPPEPPKEVFVAQPPVYQNPIVPAPDQDHTEPPTSPSVRVQPLDQGLTTTPEPTTESEHSTALQQTTAPPPKHPEVTLAQPNLTQVTVPPGDLGVNISQQPRPSETVPSTQYSVPTGLPGVKYTPEKKQPEQNATTNISICELCTCKNETLSCVGLSPKQKLHRVREPEPNAYNGTFTIINFQGNSISYIDESIWKAYRWTEKLDLSCNKIQSIERRTFEPLPFVQFINLSCNLLTELSFGTFQAWHGMQFLRKLILNHNPLTTVEDSYLFKLPALKYLDMGTTQVALTTIESILMMTLELEKLILPSRMACCLCQFKTTIEVVCQTVKLRCDSECLTDVTRCDEETSLGNAEGSLMKVLQARKKNNSTELIIEPERASSDKSAVSLSGFMNEQLDFKNESDIISARSYILPYISEGNLGDVESTLLPFLQLLFSNTQDGDMLLGLLKNNTRSPSVKPVRKNSTNKNKLRKLHFLENVLDAETQEKFDEVKKEEKPATRTRSNLLSAMFKRYLYLKKLETPQPQKDSPAKTESTEEKLLRVNRVLKGPRGLQKMHLQAVGDESVRRKQNAQPSVASTAEERRLRRPSPGKLKQLLMVQRPRKLVGKSSNAESSFIKEHKAAGSSTLKQYFKVRPSASIPPKSPSEVKSKSKDLSNTILVLEDAKARVRNIKDFELISHSGKKYIFHKIRTHRVQRKPKGKRSRKFRKKSSLNRMMLASPPFSVVRSLINSPPREAVSPSREVTSQENPFPELFSLSDPSTENTTSENNTAQNVSEEVISSGNSTLPGGTGPENTTHKDVSTAHSAVAADNSMAPVQHTNETQWEHHNTGTELSSKPTGFTFPGLTSPGDQVETQLNQQLRSLIPNNDVRRLISRVIQTLIIDCSDTHVQLACANLISRTGLLMKLLSKQQEVKVSKAEWDTGQWKSDNYISESTEAQSEQKEQESSELTKEVPGYGYNNKLILAISVTVVVTILVTLLCLIEIYSHRIAKGEDKKRSRRGFFRFLLRQRSSGESESQEGFFGRRRPLWLRDMYRPLNATRKENMAQKLHDRESSDEDEMYFYKDVP